MMTEKECRDFVDLTIDLCAKEASTFGLKPGHFTGITELQRRQIAKNAAGQSDQNGFIQLEVSKLGNRNRDLKTARGNARIGW